jgi:hypothetical protein
MSDSVRSARFGLEVTLGVQGVRGYGARIREWDQRADRRTEMFGQKIMLGNSRESGSPKARRGDPPGFWLLTPLLELL